METRTLRTLVIFGLCLALIGFGLTACDSEDGAGDNGADGCQSDTECKGDRVCHLGFCVDPLSPLADLDLGADVGADAGGEPGSADVTGTDIANDGNATPPDVAANHTDTLAQPEPDVSNAELPDGLTLAPPSLEGVATSTQLWFFATPPDVKTADITLYNYSATPMVITAVMVSNGFGEPPADFSLVDDGVSIVDGNFVPQTIGSMGLLNLTIQYEIVSFAYKSTAFLYIWTNEYPLGGDVPTPHFVALTGFAGARKMLPVARIEVPSEHQNIIAGTTITIDGSGSEGGNANVFDLSYQWWISQKPAGSMATLNVISGPIETFNADMPGNYQITLVVFGQATDGTVLHSEPQQIDIAVQ